MPNSTFRIVFSDECLADFNLLYLSSANFKYNHNTDIFVNESFVTLRVSPFQSTIATGDILQNICDAYLLDYPSLFTAEVESANTVLLTASLPNVVFSTTFLNPNLEYIIDNETVVVPDAISVSGLSSDRYLINNEINAEITSDITPIYYKTIITNLSNQQVSTGLISYPDFNSSVRLSLQSVIKSLFDYPSDTDNYIIVDQIVPNSNKFKIQIYYNPPDEEGNTTSEVLGYETTKTFIRGGKRTTLTNQTISNGIIRITDKLPVWAGYDTADYYLDTQNLIRKIILAQVPAEQIDYRRTKGCNETYVKFLNQNGGYSNWLFESHTNNEGNTNQGGFIRDNKVDDLGNEADFKLNVWAKVPKDYKQIILDLIISPEIYAMIDGVMVRVRSGRNSMIYDNIKRSYSVNINFEVDNRFNPSLLWSN